MDVVSEINHYCKHGLCYLYSSAKMGKMAALRMEWKSVSFPASLMTAEKNNAVQSTNRNPAIIVRPL